jgi:RNA polymerase-binding transcription factor DksA
MHETALEESLQAHARRVLLERWCHLAARKQAAESEARALLEVHDIDWEERATRVAAAEKLHRLIDYEGIQLRRVQAALDRLDSGAWGTCMICGASIEAERMRLEPEATQCFRCHHH